MGHQKGKRARGFYRDRGVHYQKKRSGIGTTGSGNEPALPIPLTFRTDLGIPALGLAALAVGGTLAQQRVVVEQIAVRRRRGLHAFHGTSPWVNGFGARI